MALPDGVECIVETAETDESGRFIYNRRTTFKASMDFIVFDVEIPDPRQPDAPSTAEPSTAESLP